MAINLYFKDGTVVNLPDAVSQRPLAGDDHWLELLNNQGNQYVLVPVEQLHYSQIA